MGLSETLFIATVLYAPLILSLYFLVLQPRLSDRNEAGGFMERMIDGGAVALGTPVIFSTLCLVGLNSFFVRGVLEIQPAIVGQILGGESHALAVVTAAAGLGSLLASGWIGLGRLGKTQIRKFLWPMVLMGLVTTALLNPFASLIPISLIFIVTGFTATIAGIGAQTLIQLEVEEAYRARVMTWWSTISFGSLTLGGIITGFLGDLIGIDDAILLMMLVGGSIALFVSTCIRRIA